MLSQWHPAVWIAKIRFQRRLLIWFALLTILACAAAFRIYGLNWDGDFGAHPHPDERHLANTMSRISLPWPPDWPTLLDPDTSPLNPRRINPADGSHYDLAYGTLPLYIYRGAAALLRVFGMLSFDTYDGYYVVGRAVTVLFALVTVALAYGIGKTLYGVRAGLLGAAFLAASVTHIQLSHFMTVDLALSMFTTGGLYWGIRFARHGSAKNALLLGLSLGGAMACKVSGATLLAAVGAAFVFLVLRIVCEPLCFSSSQKPIGLQIAVYFGLILLGALLLFGAFEFYALLDLQTYLEALHRQSQMVQGVNDWPFTRQYVHTTPYLYHLRNLIQWGLGWPLGIATLAAVFASIARLFWKLRSGWKRAEGKKQWTAAVHALVHDDSLWGTALLLAWCLPYFAFIGRYEVKFMRYMLPLVPSLCVLAGWLIIRLSAYTSQIVLRVASTRWGQWHLCGRSEPFLPADGGEQPTHARLALLARIVTILAVLLPTLVYALAFMCIYQRPHTWHDASRWLYTNAPKGSTISAEAWDDALPVDLPTEGHTRGAFQPNATFDIYHDMTPEAKFQHLVQTMRRSDYIVLATNRLYGAVRRLPWRYPVEIKYYELLFQEKLGFALAYTSMSYPKIWGYTFVDDSADESFIVYDHPKVLIYRKIRDLPEAELRALFGDVLKATPRVTREGNAAPVELPVPQYRKSLMLDQPVDTLPAVNDYGWNKLGSSHTLLSVLIWLLAVTMVSWAAIPLSLAVFRAFADQGYLLAKPLGLLLVAYFVWMPVSFGLWHYTVWAVLFSVVFVALLSRIVLHRQHQNWGDFWCENRRSFLYGETVFLGAFLLGLLLRLGNPDLWHPVNGGEKPMEFGFLNAILRSPTMPPYDPFFSDGYVNYYYYGLFVVSTLAKLTGLMPGIAFNLIISTLFALTVSSAYAIVATLTGRRMFGLIGGAFVTLIGPLSGAFKIRGRGGFGEVIAALRQLADPNTRGGLARAWEGFWRWLGSETLPIRTDWFWDASRTHGPYENTITEFPFWSFLFADLHPHTINIPFTLLAIALALRLMRTHRASSPETGYVLPPWLLMAITALVLGSLAITNSWDFPTFLLLCVGSLFLCHLLARPPQRLRLKQIWVGVLASVGGGSLLAALSFALYFPFFTYFRAFVKGIGRVTYPTEFNYFVGFFGVFLFILGSYLIFKVAGQKAQETCSKSEAGVAVSSDYKVSPMPDNWASGSQAIDLRDLLPAEDLPLAGSICGQIAPEAEPGTSEGHDIAGVFPRARVTKEAKWRQWLSTVTGNWLIWGTLSLMLLVPLVASRLYLQLNWKQAITLFLICELLLAAAFALVSRRGTASECFVLWLGIVGLLVALGVEVVYIRDHLGDAWYRMNTIFKFYTHTWVILAVTAAASLGLLWPRLVRLRAFDVPVISWWGVFAIMISIAALYSVFATQSRWRDRFPTPPPWGTLDGLAYMKTAVYSAEGHQIFLEPDYKAIHWLIDHIKGTPVILQAPYGYYRENGVRIAVNTGYPTVLNPLHENEQRYDELIGPRHQDAATIYRTLDASEAARLLGKYRVGYVYVGPFERAVYPSPALAKFDDMVGKDLDLIYDQDVVRIYRVHDETRLAFGAPGLESAKVVVPTIEPRPTSVMDQNLERAANAAPADAGLQFELGNRYRELGRLEDAIRVFERSIKYHPDDVAMYHTLGDTYALAGDAKKALEQYIRATEIAPDNPAAFNKLGLAYMERERFTDAVDAFKKAISSDERFAESYFHLGEAFERLGQKEQARQIYGKAREIGGGTDWAAKAVERLSAMQE